MMTSDSEAEYKYSSSNYVQVNAAYVSQCPEGELRCINGHCITISQLCDKVQKIHTYGLATGCWIMVKSMASLILTMTIFSFQINDCSDGADEAMCTY